MSTLRPSICVACVLATAAWGQGQPEDEFQRWPVEEGRAPAAAPVTVPPPPVSVPPPPQLKDPQPGLLPRISRRTRPPEVPNGISMAGAPTLGPWVRGQSAAVGFPLISVRFSIGLGERVDLGVGFDTYYLLMNEPRLTARVLLARGETWSLAASLEGGYAFFMIRASRESRGARWLTGRRNINVSPALVVSYQGKHPRAARLFLEGRYLLALDTEPFSDEPLQGVPPAVVPGHNGSLKGGAELPLSATTSFLFTLGVSVHGRATDSALMPEVSVGVVTSL